MMATTHGLWGMLVGLPVAIAAPEFGAVALTAGLLGGILPDVDLYIGHRKTLHYPVLGIGGSLVAIALAWVVPTILTVALAIAITASTIHAISDVFGGGLELRPWEGTSEKAVYSHYHNRWFRPRRYIRYDGSPEDLLLASIPVLPLIAVSDMLFQSVVVGLLMVSGVYVLLRRTLAETARRLVEYVPTEITPYVPRRYLVD